MKITDVIVRKFYRIGKMRAIVSVTLDDIFVIHDIKVIQGQNGLFIAMPSRKMVDGVYKDICHPIDSETRALFQQRILEAYQTALAEEAALSESRKDYDGYLKDSLDSDALQ